MEIIEITATKRELTGRATSVQMRREDQIPGVLYGGSEVVHFQAHQFEYDKVICTPKVYAVKLNVSGKVYDCVLKDAQFHPVSDKLIHADFLAVSDKKPVTMKIPVKLSGISEGVKQGGKLILKMRKLRVSGLIKNIPDELEIDVTNVGIGQAIKIEKLNFKNLQINESKNSVVCAVKSTRSVVKEGAPAK